MITDNLLKRVEKPARYLGNEINMIEKELDDIDIRFAFAFPDVYEIGMSHLGMETLYFFLNEREDTYCERVYTPWIDMEKVMKENNIPLFSIETQSNIKDFDFLGFTLQYEMCYTNILTMLDLSDIPFLSKDRDDSHPIIIAGGPCAYNPEPIADIVDVFYIGEGEELLYEVLDRYKNKKGSKIDFYEEIAQLDGIYIPAFYKTTYTEEGSIEKFEPINKSAKPKIRKVIYKDIDNVYYPSKQLVPLIEIVHDRVTLEIFRGCIRGCRFCQAGYVYRPVREKSVDTLVEQAETLVEATGQEEVSLVSLSTGDYSCFNELSENLLEKFENTSVNLSLPSLRIDSFTIELMSKIQKVRKSSVTFAPEAGSQKLRDVINKQISEEEILEGTKLCFNGGWNKIKLYFMIGLPTETMEDVLAIGALGDAILNNDVEKKSSKKITISTSCFIPKPFTPFQWEKQNTYDEFMDKQITLKKNITNKNIRYIYHDAKLSVLEGVFARGDRKLSTVLIEAYKLGARFDGWSEHFNYSIWKQAFENTNIEMDFYVKEHKEDEVLPWDFIDIGVTKDFLLSERHKAYDVKTTANCRDKCNMCGAQNFKGGICYEDKI